MRGEKRNREISDSYQEDEGEKVGSELGKFLELFGEEIKLSMSKKSSIIESTEAINKILDNINNVDIDNNVLFYFVNDKAIRIFEEYLLYLESKIDSETSDIIFKSLKLFLNVIFDISNLEYGGEYENIKPMVLGMFLDSNIIKNLMDVINKVELQFENECNLISKKSTYYEEILFDYFNLLESILELDPKRSSSELLKCKKLFSWLLNSLEDDIGTTGGDNNARANKAIGSISQSKIEILSIMFQNMNYSDIIELETFSVNIMDLLLIKLANMGLINGEVIGYENREFVHNIIDIICSLLLFEKERLNFVELEGIELMLKFIKEKIFLRSLSVKVLSFALLSNSSINNKFVKLLGLKQIFALLNHSILELNKRKSKTKQQQDTDEHICSIIKSLLHYCKGNELKRVLDKLTNENFGKLKLLAKLREFYSNNIFNSLEYDEDNVEIAETIAIDAGLFIVQLIDIILFYTFYYIYFEFSGYDNNYANENGILETILELGITVEDISTSIDDYSNSLENDELTLINHMRSKINI